MNLIVDTGSSWTWLSGKSCTGCPGTTYLNTDSTSFLNKTLLNDITYGQGFVEGFISEDVFSLNASKSTSDFNQKVTFLLIKTAE